MPYFCLRPLARYSLIPGSSATRSFKAKTLSYFPLAFKAAIRLGKAWVTPSTTCGNGRLLSAHMRRETEDYSHLVEDQVCRGGRRSYQVRPTIVLRLRVGLQDSFEMPEEFREPKGAVGFCSRCRCVLLILVVVVYVDWVMHVVGLGNLMSMAQRCVDSWESPHCRDQGQSKPTGSLCYGFPPRPRPPSSLLSRTLERYGSKWQASGR